MDLSDVALFVRVVEHGGFTAAARVLRIPKSTVSRRIVRLEDGLGVRLLQRTSRRQGLTQAGAAFFERVRASVIAIEAAKAEVSELSEEPRGVLRVAGLPDLGGAPFPELIGEFTARYAKVRVELHVSPEQVDLVAGRYDVAIRAGAFDDSSLIGRKLVDTALRLYASPRYLDQRGRPRRFSDLERHDHIGLTPTPSVPLEGPRGTVRYRPRCRLSANDMKLLDTLTRAGAGIALLSESVGERGVSERQLERVLPQYARTGAISLLYPSGRQLDAKLRAFRDFMLERTARLRS